MTSADTPKSLLRDYFETIATCVLFVLFARTFVFQQSKIPTGSMIPTLLIGDYIMVNKFVYSPVADEIPLFGSLERFIMPVREVGRGDVVVFKFPEEPEKDYIKRLQTEMEQERKLQQEKRKQEREYLHKMMIENEKNKALMKGEELKQKEEDAKAQDEYARMLQKQEDDRNAEMSKREARA